MPNARSKALVTGASRGLGLAIARSLSVTHDVVGVARSGLDSQEDSQRIDHRQNVDLGRTEELDRLAGDLRDCDVLVNNAGMAVDGVLATQSFERIEEMQQFVNGRIAT